MKQTKTKINLYMYRDDVSYWNVPRSKIPVNYDKIHAHNYTFTHIQTVMINLNH